MRFFFARHGQTDWNVLKKVQGTTDVPLNDVGIHQAEELCENLHKINANLFKVYSSYQKRALETAQIVSEEFQVPLEAIDGLEEMSMGDFEGHTWEEIKKLYPEELKRWNSQKRYNTSPNGESYQMVLERLFRALGTIQEQVTKEERAPEQVPKVKTAGEQVPEDQVSGARVEDKDILIVSHSAVIMVLIALQKNVPFEQAYTIEVENAKPIEFSFSELEEIRKRV